MPLGIQREKVWWGLLNSDSDRFQSKDGGRGPRGMEQGANSSLRIRGGLPEGDT